MEKMKSSKKGYVFNTLPNDKILDVTELKAFTDYKLNVAKPMISLLVRVENTVGKGTIACNQHFILFRLFSKAFFFRVVKSQDCVVKC